MAKVHTSENRFCKCPLLNIENIGLMIAYSLMCKYTVGYHRMYSRDGEARTHGCCQCSSVANGVETRR